MKDTPSKSFQYLRSSERNLEKKGFVEKEFQKVNDTYLEMAYLC